MMKNSTTSRRQFLTGSILTAGSIAAGNLTSALAYSNDEIKSAVILIKNATVISMDPSKPIVEKGDILVENGIISKTGKNLKATAAEIIEASNMIALPGFIETHWHMWTTVLRALSGRLNKPDYFNLSKQSSAKFSPEDIYYSTLLACAEAINGGITFVHDWNHNVRSTEHAGSDLAALKKAGIRARFSMGVANGESIPDMNLLKKLHDEWKLYSNNNLIELGFASPGLEKDETRRIKEIETARALKIPISAHVDRKKDNSDTVEKFIKHNLLASDLQLIHAVRTSPQELDLISRAGSSITVSPYSELKIGYGFPPVHQMLKSGVNIGLSVDTITLTGNADMFSVMKLFANVANGLSEDEFVIDNYKVLQLATIEGAGSMGIHSLTGSITEGKRADLQLVSTDAINMTPLTDPVSMIVLSAQPFNVDTVLIDGVIKKRNGRLIMDIKEIGSKAAETFKQVS